MELLLLSTIASAMGQATTATNETFETLPIGTNIFSKVTVLNKTRTDLFIKHSQGMSNIKVKDLDPGTQMRLGYQIEQPKPTKMEQVLEATSIRQLESDPRVQEVEERIAAELGEALDRVDDQAAFAIAGGITFLYLLFSFLCRSICLKTGNPPNALVWLPFFKQIPLLKAAGMSGWWILTNFIPIIFLVVYIMWCFRIVHSRGKHVVFAVLLLLPVTNVVAFLYLALSGDGTGPDPSKRHLINLRNPPKRLAA
jgi:hypothetical protein